MHRVECRKHLSDLLVREEGVEHRRFDHAGRDRIHANVIGRQLYGEILSDPEEVEMRALLAFSLWMGSKTIAADHKPYRRDDLMRRARDWLHET